MIVVKQTKYTNEPIARCPGPKADDCSNAFGINNYHNIVLGFSFFFLIYISAFYFLYFCFVCELSRCIQFH